MPSGPRDASQTLYAMAAQAKWRSRCRHQPAEVFSESWSVQCPVSMSLTSHPPAKSCIVQPNTQGISKSPTVTGFVDGFCGALSTASTFTSEFRMLKEAPHAPRGYVYAAMMLLAGQVAAIPFVASIPSM